MYGPSFNGFFPRGIRDTCAEDPSNAYSKRTKGRKPVSVPSIGYPMASVLDPLNRLGPPKIKIAEGGYTLTAPKSTKTAWARNQEQSEATLMRLTPRQWPCQDA